MPTVKKPSGDKGLALNSAGNQTGMHNKGDSEHMKKIRGMRKIYNKQMPVLACNSCAFQNACPKFRAGYECAFVPFLRSHNIDTEDDLLEEMKNLVTAGMQRTHLALTMETLTGGSPTVENSEAISMLFTQLKDMHEVMTEIEEEEVEFSDSKSITGAVFGNLSDFVGTIDESLEELSEISHIPTLEDSSPLESVVEASMPKSLPSTPEEQIQHLQRDFETGQLDTATKSELDIAKKTQQDIVVVSVGTRKKEIPDGASRER